jgi:general secretion pathway protein E
MRPFESNAAMPPALGGALADCLEESKALSADDLSRARAAAGAADKRLDQALLDLGLITSGALNDLLVSRFGVTEVEPKELPAAPVLPELFKPTFLGAAQIIPVAADAAAITLAMVEPFDDFTASAVSLKSSRDVRRRRIARSRFEAEYERLYGVSLTPVELEPAPVSLDTTSGDIELLKDAASDAPVVRFVQDAVRLAVEQNASDIHLRPTRGRPEMLFRIGGQLEARQGPEARQFASVISRLKILANLDISEQRLPQDGRMRTNVAGRPIDIRISTMPHVYGEGAVLRLLSRELAASSLGELGFSPAISDRLGRLFGIADGMILVTGPTGSGKTTTLHAALKTLIRPEMNAVTIEDPVEYRIDGVAQVQVDEKIGLTFPRVLRSLLRQDPDIILVGEIRDTETARIAVQAALTGHLLLATLHTNSALAAVPRLVDMGVEPYLLAAVLRGVLAQRLVRRRCPQCGGLAAGDCHTCGSSGFVGRVAIGELLTLDAEVTECLARSAELSADHLERIRTSGYRPLREDAEARIAAGEIEQADLRGLVDVD